MNTHYVIDGNFDFIPEMTGIYSWYYPIRIYEEDTYESFIHRILYFLNFSFMSKEQNSWIDFEYENSWETFRIAFNRKGKLNSTIQKNWEDIKKDKDFIKSVFETSFWNRPLYIGKADNLYNRIIEHQTILSTFSKRFEIACKDFSYQNDNDFRFASSLSMRNLLLSYSVVDLQFSSILALEKILQHSAKPNFSIK